MSAHDIITIDGPAGSGKSTAARGLARRLGIRYFNSGALYRAIACLANARGVDLADTKALVDVVRRTKFETRNVDGTEHVLLDGDDVTDRLFQNEISRKIYLVADPPEIRREVGRLARELNVGSSFVTEGRDQGTEVFPEARVKFYLDARPEVRAERRRIELEQRGEKVSSAEVLKQILDRDRRDKGRPVGALRVAPEAIVVDNSTLTADQTVELLVGAARKRCPELGDAPTMTDDNPNKHRPNPEAHTTLRRDGGAMYVPGTEPRTTIMAPPEPHPLRLGLRYTLSPLTLGKLERLAKARFDIRQLTEIDIETWEENAETQSVLVQSVIASSEIEGEGIPAEEVTLDLTGGGGRIPADSVKLDLTAVTRDDLGLASRELEVRKRAVKAIYEAALWSLTREWRPFITYEFVLELHKKMFDSTKPDIAGRIKTGTVYIRGGGYNIETLSATRSEEFLRALCERTNASLEEARTTSGGSMFLTTAEFISDFLAIHPFADGNGRTARILSTYLLERAGYHFARFYPLDLVILENRARYYESLYESQHNWYLSNEDMTPWIDFYTDAVFIQWMRAHQRVLDEAHRKKG